MKGGKKTTDPRGTMGGDSRGNRLGEKAGDLGEFVTTTSSEVTGRVFNDIFGPGKGVRVGQRQEKDQRRP